MYLYYQHMNMSRLIFSYKIQSKSKKLYLSLGNNISIYPKLINKQLKSLNNSKKLNEKQNILR